MSIFSGVLPPNLLGMTGITFWIILDWEEVWWLEGREGSKYPSIVKRQRISQCFVFTFCVYICLPCKTFSDSDFFKLVETTFWLVIPGLLWQFLVFHWWWLVTPAMSAVGEELELILTNCPRLCTVAEGAPSGFLSGELVACCWWLFEFVGLICEETICYIPPL